MRAVQPYKQLNKIVKDERFEPDMAWGLRMAIAAMVPLFLGLYTGRVEEAGWAALIAECICWVELKGSFEQRLKLLAGSSFFALLFAIIGSVTGQYVWLSVMLMGVVAFLSSLFKNMGDRGSGLAICVFALFIFCNAYPTTDVQELGQRILYLSVGVLWNFLLAVVSSFFIKAQRPYKRSVATVWKSVAELVSIVSKGWDGSTTRSGYHDVYIKEKAIRAAIDDSLSMFQKLADETSEQDGDEYRLSHVRKAAALVGVQVIAISQELEPINRVSIPSSIKVKLFTLMRALEQTLDRMSVYTINADRREELILRSRINRLLKLSKILKSTNLKGLKERQHILRVVQLVERVTKITESALGNLQAAQKERSMVSAYPMLKTIYILHPKYWIRQIKVLFNFRTLTTRYAMRTGVAAGIAMFVYKYFAIDHGFWVPLTLMIVMQTYFGATLLKARDRTLGTLGGGVVAGLLLYIPAGIFLQEVLLFLSFIPMMYYLRRNYAWATFFITINLVLLFNINRELDGGLILVRALSTIAGAGIAIMSGFVLMPTWDKKWLPVYMSKAVHSNYEYFLSLFYEQGVSVSKLKHKRIAESANSNAFDSFNRYMGEPSFGKKRIATYYYTIMHNIRVTRELNNLMLADVTTNKGKKNDKQAKQKLLIEKCNELFVACIVTSQRLDSTNVYNVDSTKPIVFSGLFNKQQQVYLEKLCLELEAMNGDLEILANKLQPLPQLS